VRRIGILCALVVVAGCGSEDAYESELRPPVPINVTAAIGENRVRVSPETFGAGPVVFVIANQSGAPQEVTFESDEVAGGPGITRSTREIADGATGTLKVDAPEGTYVLSGSGVEPASVSVGEPRPSSQDRLLLP
jgi:hypothetical protein